ncbi:Dityrosine transporter 1 [Coemansia guatemalensis]|uniref:Dityrosine transporter 1 n=1 Tax=Coemansia guatemalensis TaxID=2761395 RepID=A0A9W8LUK4_9FUNG|nr:Dityrosine transporter 1 [Coemansia guatemalensis]
MAVFPLLWSNLADYIGRKPVYALSMLIFICGSIGCALSQSLPALIASRIVQSAGASAVQGAGAGTISDIYPRERRGTALGLYYLGPLLGPCLGPLIGGYIGEGAGWRWVFWVLTIWGGIMLLFAVFVLPETHRRIVAKKHAIQQINIPPLLGLKDNNPLQDIATVRYPVIALAMLHFAMLFGTYFTNATAQPLAYESIYGLSQGMSGLCFLSSGVGCVVGSTVGGRVTDLLIRRHHSALESQTSDKEQGCAIKVPAEVRLGAMWIGSTLFLCGVVICGWLLQYKLSLAGVLVTQFLIGSGMAFTFQSLGGYLIDVFPTRSARITGVQNFWRSAWAAVIVQLSPTMLENIGWGWTYTTMFFLTLASLLLMQLVVYRGETMRQRYGPGADPR